MNENSVSPLVDLVIDVYFLLLSITLGLLGIVSIYKQLYLERLSSYSSFLVLIMNVIVLTCFCASFIFYYVPGKRKYYRIIIAVPFTFYMFCITLLTSYYYIIPVYGILLSAVVFILTKTKDKTKAVYVLTVTTVYIIIMFFQSTDILPIFEKNFQVNKNTALGVAAQAFLLIVGLIMGGFLVYKNRSKHVINIRAVTRKENNIEEIKK